MADTGWKVAVDGVVSRTVNAIRLPVTEGDWLMQRTPAGTYRLSRPSVEPFEISQNEVDVYIRAKSLKIIEGTWP